jgi:septal ring factor EnvC (AmiA/AmiB activator)
MRFIMSKSLIFFVLFCSILWAKPKSTRALDPELQKTRQELERIQNELEVQKKTFEKIRKNESNLLENLQLTDQQLQKTQNALLEIDANSQVVEKNVKLSEHILDSLKQSIQTQKKFLALRIKTLYVQGQKDRATHILMFLEQKKGQVPLLYWTKLFAKDQQLIFALQKTIGEKQKHTEFYQGRLNELLAVKTIKSKEQMNFDLEKKNQENRLNSVRMDKELQEKALDEYEDQQNQMSSLLKTLQIQKEKEERLALKKAQTEKPKNTRKKFEKPKSKVQSKVHSKEEPEDQNDEPETAVAVKEKSSDNGKCWPIHGRINDNYGKVQSRIEGITMMNNFITIAGQMGEPVRSAAEGTVVHIDGDFFKRGKGLIIQSSRGELFSYAHLKRVNVQVGQSIQSCQVIGTVGDEGSYNGPQLYFQIYQKNPIQWLKNAQ